MSLAASSRSIDLPKTTHEVTEPQESSESHRANGRKWTWELLISAWLLAALWFASWTWGPTRQIWNSMDVAVFRLANASLAEPTIWRMASAAANARIFDVIAFAAIASLLAYCAVRRGGRWREEALSVILLLIMVGAAKFMVADLVLGEWCHFRRASPTVTFQAVRLSEVEPWIQTKDASHYCFPSDHGTFLLAVAFYTLIRSPRQAGWAFGLAVMFAMPRIISGAHWLTDFAIGSMFVAFAAVSALMMTPLHDRVIEAFRRLWCRPVTLEGIRTNGDA